jgi:hypothetical protein
MGRLKRYVNLITMVTYRPIFRCQWVKPKVVVVDEYGLTTVELQSVGYKDD